MAILVGGSICFFILLAAGHAALINSGSLASPYFITMPFLGTILVMGFELSSGLLKSARLGKQLQTSQADLKKSQNRLGVAADAANLGLWTWDIARNKIWMNDQCERMMGVQPGEDMSLDSVLLKLHQDDRKNILHTVQKAINSRGQLECEFRVCEDPRAIRWIHSRGRIEQSAEGNPAYLHGACSDITERRQSEERFRVIFEVSPNGLLLTDSQGKVILANTEAERMFGYSIERLQGRSILEITGNITHDFSVPTGEPIEIIVSRKDGTSFPVSITLKHIRTSLDFLLLASMTDLTDRNEVERVAALQRSEIEHLSRITMLGEVTGSIAHELNQPLTAILTNAETAQRILTTSPTDTPVLGDILTDIVDDVSRAAEIIRLLRTLQKKGEINHQEIDLHNLVRDAIRILNSEAAMRNITVHLNLAESLPCTRGNRVQLEQVIINLMLNAFDAITEAATLQRIVTIETSLDDDNMVHIAVSDSGIGLNAETLQCMFDPFFTSKPHGLGLGLPICKTIVEAHVGSLSAHNNQDTGATVTLSLPCHSKLLSQESSLPL